MRKNGDFKRDLETYDSELEKVQSRIAASREEVARKREKSKDFDDTKELDPSLEQDDQQVTAALSAVQAIREISPPTAVWPC